MNVRSPANEDKTYSAIWAAWHQNVEAQKTAYRLSMIQRKRDKINERLDDEEMKAMGIEQYSDPELDREMQKIDRELLQMERKMLNEAIEWVRKCTEHAKQKLSHAK